MVPAAARRPANCPFAKGLSCQEIFFLCAFVVHFEKNLRCSEVLYQTDSRLIKEPDEHQALFCGYNNWLTFCQILL